MDDGQGRHLPARRFAERLRAAKAILVHSSLIFLEAPQCWRKLYGRNLLPHSKQSSLTEIDNRIAAFKEAEEALRGFLASFDRYEVPISKNIMKAASGLVAQFNLGSHDAAIVAVARSIHVPDLVALDKGFRRVDNIALWDGLL
jgi:predicted nucleic acid-binding protein